MAFELRLEPKHDYLHAIVTGDNTREDVFGYLRELLQACQQRQVTRVLIEERLTGPRLGPVDVFDIAAQGSTEAAGSLTTIAYVDVHAIGDAMKFAENVAVNRGLPVRMFATVAEAEQWLAER
jgi:hypothetical protein